MAILKKLEKAQMNSIMVYLKSFFFLKNKPNPNSVDRKIIKSRTELMKQTHTHKNKKTKQNKKT